MRSKNLLIAFFALSQFSCGYFRSGTWEDDPRNWEHALRSGKPDDVVVLHSKYWRSPHWTYEYEYLFEIQKNEKLKEQLFTENKLLKIEGKDATEAKESHFAGVPSWFTPKSVDKYDIWIYKDEPRGNFRLFIDKETGDMFLSDYQV